MQPIVSPSLLSADFSRLAEAIEKIESSSAEWVHLDVMDGHFVPNLTFGMPIVKALRKLTKRPFDVHLMMEHPEDYIEAFREAGANILTVHWEACRHLHRTVQQIHQAGCLAGVAVNPHTPVDALSEIIYEVDLVLVMAVNPGFGGQQFIRHAENKVSRMSALIEDHQAPCLLQVDGGIHGENASNLVAAGADCLVAGAFLFQTGNFGKGVEQLKKEPVVGQHRRQVVQRVVGKLQE